MRGVDQGSVTVTKNRIADRVEYDERFLTRLHELDKRLDIQG